MPLSPKDLQKTDQSEPSSSNQKDNESTSSIEKKEINNEKEEEPKRNRCDSSSESTSNKDDTKEEDQCKTKVNQDAKKDEDESKRVRCDSSSDSSAQNSKQIIAKKREAQILNVSQEESVNSEKDLENSKRPRISTPNKNKSTVADSTSSNNEISSSLSSSINIKRLREPNTESEEDSEEDFVSESHANKGVAKKQRKTIPLEINNRETEEVESSNLVEESDEVDNSEEEFFNRKIILPKISDLSKIESQSKQIKDEDTEKPQKILISSLEDYRLEAERKAQRAEDFLASFENESETN